MNQARRAADLFQQHRDELGFVNEAQCREKTLYTETRDGETVGAALVNHCVQKPQTTLYEIAVREDHRRNGIGKSLVEQIKADTPHSKIVAKCPVDLSANGWYERTGWDRINTIEKSDKRDLNVWQLSLESSVDVVMTIAGKGDTANAIRESGARIGIESGKTWPFDFTPFFLDFPFTNPNATTQDHIDAVKALEPALTVAPDVEKGRVLDDVIPIADELLDHAGDVIIVPKDCHPTEIPERFRVGLTVGSFGSMAPWGLYEYADCDSIHLLGGTPNQQLTVKSHGLAIDSVDSYTLGVRAQYGMWDGKAKDAPDGWDYKKRLRVSLDNYADVWA